jgi:hypothetical protein
MAEKEMILIVLDQNPHYEDFENHLPKLRRVRYAATHINLIIKD